VSPPSALSPIEEKFKRGEVKFPPVAKSRDTHSNALAYAKRAEST